MKVKTVSIRVRPETRGLLRKIGRKGETYDDVIRRLIREAGYGGAEDDSLAE